MHDMVLGFRNKKTDRNNSSRGVIVREDGTKELASVYDNETSLNWAETG